MKKLIAKSLVVMLVLTMLPILPNMRVLADDDYELIAHLSFDNLTTGLKGAGATATASKDDMLISNETAIVGSSGKSLSFDGTAAAGYLTLAKDDGTPLLSDVDTFAISYYSKPKTTTATYYGWVYNVRRDIPGSFSESNLNYIGVTDRPDGVLKAERFQSGNRTETLEVAMDRERWKHMLIQYEPDKTTVYLNGVTQASWTTTTANQSVLLPLSEVFEDNSNFKIGAADWTATPGEYYSGLLDEFSVYSGVVPETKITELAEASIAELTGLNVSSAGDATKVKVGGTLQLTAEPIPSVWEAPVTWTSSNTDVASVDANGLVTGKAEGGPVTITATSTTNPAISDSISLSVYKTCAVKYLTTSGGRITGGNATQEVEKGQDAVEVTATPNANYLFVKWSDGETNPKRTDRNIQADLTVTAEFKQDTVKAIYNAGEGGKVRMMDEENLQDKLDIEVIRGQNAKTIVAVPDSGYKFDKWSDEVTTDERTDLALTQDLEVTASFVRDLITVTYNTSAGGKIQGKAQQEIIRGQNTEKVTAVPDNGYQFVQWSDGLKTADRTDPAVADNLTVTAVFEKIPGPIVSSIVLDKKKLTVGVNEKFTLKATVVPASAGSSIKWSVSNTAIATVNQKGQVTPKKAGTAIIKAEAGGKTYSCTVTVKNAPKSITLNAKKKTLKKGKTFNIKVKFPKNTFSNKVTFKPGNKRIATVTDKGKVKAIKKGKTKITVTTFNKKKATITITVK